MAENLGKSVGELVTGKPVPLSVGEFYLWAEYRKCFGFATDRLEWATANAGAATARSMGGRVTSEDIVPKFGRTRSSKKKLIHQLAALAGAKVVFTPKDGGPQLTGEAALKQLDESDGAESRGERATLDGKRPLSPRRPNTLGGD